VLVLDGERDAHDQRDDRGDAQDGADDARDQTRLGLTAVRGLAPVGPLLALDAGGSRR